jgi:hypothetical protein
VVKICLWLLQVGVAVVIIGLWVATAVGIGDKVRRRRRGSIHRVLLAHLLTISFFFSSSFSSQDISRTDSFESSCTIGTKFQ